MTGWWKIYRVVLSGLYCFVFPLAVGLGVWSLVHGDWWFAFVRFGLAALVVVQYVYFIRISKPWERNPS